MKLQTSLEEPSELPPSCPCQGVRSEAQQQAEPLWLMGEGQGKDFGDDLHS